MKAVRRLGRCQPQQKHILILNGYSFPRSCVGMHITVSYLSRELEFPNSLKLILSKDFAQSMVRIVGHNMALTQEIEIQRLKIPGLQFQDITQVKANGECYDFSESAAVRLQSMIFDQ